MSKTKTTHSLPADHKEHPHPPACTCGSQTWTDVTAIVCIASDKIIGRI